jgi:hypothetical protein
VTIGDHAFSAKYDSRLHGRPVGSKSSSASIRTWGRGRKYAVSLSGFIPA